MLVYTFSLVFGQAYGIRYTLARQSLSVQGFPLTKIGWRRCYFMRHTFTHGRSPRKKYGIGLKSG